MDNRSAFGLPSTWSAGCADHAVTANDDDEDLRVSLAFDLALTAPLADAAAPGNWSAHGAVPQEGMSQCVPQWQGLPLARVLVSNVACH